jgi:GNAT superfamily N-acetyltransferase
MSGRAKTPEPPGRAISGVEIHPLTPNRWPDLEKLFGPGGAYGGCWCMWFRMRRREFDASAADERKAGLRRLAQSERPPGLLAYLDGVPAAWVSLGPREEFPHLEHSRTLVRVDDRPVWSIVCFVVSKGYRGRGMSGRLLEAAVIYARKHGAQAVEAYPIEPGGGLKGYDGFTGIISTFQRAGFIEVARPRPRQAIMRLDISRPYENR